MIFFKNIFSKQNNITLKNELFSGIVNYLTCAYIAVINPMILAEANIPESDVFLATCITIGCICFFMAFRTNLPIIIGPTSSINTYFLAGIVGNLGLSWQEGLSATFLSGIIILLLSHLNLRKKINLAIPQFLTDAIIFGIGIFLLIISLKISGIFIIGDNFSLDFINLVTFATAVAASLILDKFKVPGSSVIGIFLATVIYQIFSSTHITNLVTIPSGFKQSLFALNLANCFHAKNLAATFAMTVIVLLDSNASLNAITKKIDKNNNSSCSKPFEGIGAATILGSLLGTSSSGVFLECLSGVKAGGKTGISTLVTGILFLFTLFLSPLIHIIPNSATTAVLFLISISIISHHSFFKSLNISELIPAIITIVIIPIQFSIADGIGAGIISYSLIHILKRDWIKFNPYLIGINTLFCCFFITKYIISNGFF